MTVAGWVNINIMLLLNIVEVNVVTTSGFYIINYYQNVKFIIFYFNNTLFTYYCSNYLVRPQGTVGPTVASYVRYNILSM